MVKDKDNSKNSSSNSLVFGLWPMAADKNQECWDLNPGQLVCKYANPFAMQMYIRSYRGGGGVKHSTVVAYTAFLHCFSGFDSTDCW